MECINYKYKPWHLLFIHPDILYRVCLSYDKTEMFVVGLVRLIIHGLIFSFTFKPYDETLRILYAPFYIFSGIYFLLSLFVLLIIFTKQQKVPANMTKYHIRKSEETPTKDLINKVTLKNKSRKPVPNYFFETTH